MKSFRVKIIMKMKPGRGQFRSRWQGKIDFTLRSLRHFRAINSIALLWEQTNSPSMRHNARAAAQSRKITSLTLREIYGPRHNLFTCKFTARIYGGK